MNKITLFSLAISLVFMLVGVSCSEVNCELGALPFVCVRVSDQNGTPVLPDQIHYQRKDSTDAIIFLSEIEEFVFLSKSKIRPICLYDRGNEGTYEVIFKLKEHIVRQTIVANKDGGCYPQTHNVKIIFPFVYCDKKLNSRFSHSYDFSKSCQEKEN